MSINFKNIALVSIPVFLIMFLFAALQVDQNSAILIGTLIYLASPLLGYPIVEETKEN